MRRKLLLTALTVGVAGALLPASPAAAYCDPLLSDLSGRCTNSCVETGKRYESLDQKVGDKLPDYYDLVSCLA